MGEKPDPLIVIVVGAVLIPKSGSMDVITGAAAFPILGRIRLKRNNIEHMGSMKDLLYISKPSTYVLFTMPILKSKFATKQG
ncbi:MAG: hypothetical protein ACMUIL_07345 [bacterium]